MSSQIAIPQINSGLTKTSLKVLSAQFVENVIDFGDVLQAATALSAAENFIKEVKSSEKLKAAVRGEIEKEGKVSTLPSGAKLELAETGTIYNFDNCEDDDLIDLLKMQAEFNERVKARQDMLKTLPLAGIDLAMTSSGEVKRIYPPSKTSTSSYKVTLAK